MSSNYTLHLVPENGPTLTARTTDEWSLGYMFKVLSSDLLSMRRGSRITIDDIDTIERYQGLNFTITFKDLSVEEYVHAEAEHDYGFEQAAKLLTRGQ
tara:strand:+ start:1534 stop:1827 length:294 start_codon:yes stop_codon:yes gene_type:complete